MANAMIPPMDPQQMAAMGMPNPFAPPPPPSPSLGFQVWASDPQNAHKVMPSMTQPDQPLQPNAGAQAAPQMASVNPPQPPPMASVNPPSFDGARASAQPSAPSPMSMPSAPAPAMPSMTPPVQSQGQATLGADQAELQRLQKTGSGASQIKNPILRTLAKVGDIAAPFIVGQGAMAIPGTTAHNMWLQNVQQGRVQNDQSALQANAQLADTQSQTGQRNAMAAKADSQAESYAPVTLTQEQAEAIGQPGLAGETLSSRAYTSMLTGKQKNDSNERVQGGKNQTATTIASGKNQTAAQIATERNQRITQLAEAANKTKLLMQDKKDATSRANTSDHIAAKGTPGAPGGGKVPTDVTKRAALASNVLENADAVDQLVSKRPDIVGAAGGRYTSVQQMVGSDDPDIQELGVRMHNIALASNGAHGLRSAEAVAQTEHELFNNFKTGPQGIKGALRGTRQSVQTFLDDEKNFQQSGSRTGNPMKPPTQGGALAPTHVFNPATGQVEAVTR